MREKSSDNVPNNLQTGGGEAIEIIFKIGSLSDFSFSFNFVAVVTRVITM